MLEVRLSPPATDTPEYRQVAEGTHVLETDYLRGGGKPGRGHGEVTEVKYKDGKGLVARVRFDQQRRAIYTMTARRAGALKVAHDMEADCGQR